MAMLLQRMAVMQMVPSMAQDGDDPDTQGLAQLAQTLPAEATQLLYSLCLHGRNELGLAPDEYAALTMVLLRLLAFQPKAASAEKKSPSLSHQALTEVATPLPAPAASRLSAPSPSPVSSPAQTPAPSATPAPAPAASTALRAVPVREAREPTARVDLPKPAAQATVELTAEGDDWLQMVQGMMAQEAITALVRELALQSQLLARDAHQWQLRVERESLKHPASRERLQAALLAAGHGPVQLHIEIGPVTDSPAKRLAVKAAEHMAAAQEMIHNDPLVQAMVRDFGAKIVPGSIQLI
jgi:DNA polymerase-3 subunit gamma/tau